MSARVRVQHAPPFVLDIVDERAAHLAEPLVGVTTDGVVRRGLRTLDAPRVDTAPITDAALAFLQALTGPQRRQATFSMDAAEWRMWINVHMNHFRHGVMLEDLAPAGRELALDVLRATMSTRGFGQARSVMRLNELLAELTGDREAFGEWPYFMSIFGTPGAEEPWGWQIDGHHLCLNVVVFDGRIVMTPSFMGAEPRRVRRGRLAGTSLFDPEEAFGLDLIRSFDADQRDRAILYPSIHPDHIPPRLQNPFDGRMQAGAFHDNLVAPYQGVAGDEMSDGQRRVVLALVSSYAGWWADGHAEVQMRDVEAHLDETWFSWYGGFDDEAPFYYRVHSPVVLIEFDHHPGVAFDNEVPSRHHVHTVVRTPNGGDYGADLLEEHHARFDHRAVRRGHASEGPGGRGQQRDRHHGEEHAGGDDGAAADIGGTVVAGDEHDHVAQEQPLPPPGDRAAEDVLEDDDVTEPGAEGDGRVATERGDGEADARRHGGERDTPPDDAGERRQRRVVRSEWPAVEGHGGPQGEGHQGEHDEGEHGRRDEHGQRLGHEQPPATRLPGQRRRHSPRRELGAHQRRAQCPAHQCQPRAHSLEDVPEITPPEPRIAHLADRLVREADVGDLVGDLLVAFHPVRAQARFDLLFRGFEALLGLGDPRLVGLLGE